MKIKFPKEKKQEAALVPLGQGVFRYSKSTIHKGKKLINWTAAKFTFALQTMQLRQ